MFRTKGVNMITLKTEAIIACSEKIEELDNDGTTFGPMELSMKILKKARRKELEGQEYLQKTWLLSACNLACKQKQKKGYGHNVRPGSGRGRKNKKKKSNP